MQNKRMILTRQSAPHMRPLCQKMRKIKNKSLFFCCLVTYLLFVLLIITEPIGYDPFLLCVVFAIVFAVLYLFLTASALRISEKIHRASEKFPKRIKAILNGFAYLIICATFFALGWIFHRQLSDADEGNLDIFHIAILVSISVNVVIRGYKDYLKK